MSMMPLNNDATLIRDGREIPIMVCMMSDAMVFAELDVDALEGDVFRCDLCEKVVAEITRLPGPAGRGHAELKLVSKSEWKRLQPAPANVNQYINSATNVAGRDVVISNQFIQLIEHAIRNDSDIPEEKKIGMLARIREYVTDPKFIEAAVTLVKSLAK